MIVSLIVAMDEHRGIGRDGKVPWHLSADLRRLKKLTMGHHLIMGRLTFESIGRVLPGRVMIVVTRSPNYDAPGCLVVHSIEDALTLAQERAETEVFVFGGGEIYKQTIALADRIYLTQVQALVDCDVFFPLFEWGDWEQLESSFHPVDSDNQYPSSFYILSRLS